MQTTTDVLCSTLTKVLCQARGTLAGVDHKLVNHPRLLIACTGCMYLVSSFVVVCLNLSSSVRVYGSMPVLGVNVCQLITNLSYILNFILCLLCYQSAGTDGTYRLHSCFRWSFVPHSPWLSCPESTVLKSRGPVSLKFSMVDLY